MSRRGRPVPEAAPLLGVVLAFGVAGFGVRFAPPASRLAVLGVAVTVLYGFTGFGVARAPDPAGAIPPDATLAGGLLAAGGVAGYGLAAGQPFVGLFVAVWTAAPPVAYHARYGDPVSPLSPDRTFLAAVGGALAVALAGLAVGRPALGAATGALVVLAAADYRTVCGGRLPRTVEGALVATPLAGSVIAVGYFAVAGRATVGLLVGASLVAVGAYFALAGERPRRGVG